MIGIQCITGKRAWSRRNGERGAYTTLPAIASVHDPRMGCRCGAHRDREDPRIQPAADLQYDPRSSRPCRVRSISSGGQGDEERSERLRQHMFILTDASACTGRIHRDTRGVLKTLDLGERQAVCLWPFRNDGELGEGKRAEENKKGATFGKKSLTSESRKW